MHRDGYGMLLSASIRNMWSQVFTLRHDFPVITLPLVKTIFNFIIFLSASSDGAARLWDVAEGTVQREYTGHQKAITALALEDIAKE